MRVPNAAKRDVRRLAAITATPWSLHEAEQPTVVFREQAERREAVDPPMPMARRVYTKPKDITMYGYTSGCPTCEHEMKFGPNRTSKPHSAACRSRIMLELAKTPEGQKRLAAAAERMDRVAGELGREMADAASARPAAQGEEVEIAPSSSTGAAVRAQVGPSDDSSNPFLVRDVAPKAAEPSAVDRRLPEPAYPGVPTAEAERLVASERLVESAHEPMDPGMDIDLVDEEKPSSRLLGGTARFIACRDLNVKPIDREREVDPCVADGSRQVGRTDREGSCRSTGTLVHIDPCESKSRTDKEDCPEAATVARATDFPEAFDRGEVEQKRVVDPTTPSCIDRSGSIDGGDTNLVFESELEELQRLLDLRQRDRLDKSAYEIMAVRPKVFTRLGHDYD